MIGYIEGTLLEVTETSCLVLTAGGLGYELFLPGHLFAKLPEKSGKVQFYVHTQVREDALELFGFSTWDERETFQTLISINRVGARTALGVLGTFRPDDLRSLVIDEDVFGLTQVSGIGKKTAQQIFLELKFKLKLDNVPVRGGSAQAGGASLLRDAVAGLANLGYAEDEAAFVVKEVLKDEPELDLGSILRAALKKMAKRN
ncbi:MAG: Holliday junction branch migration protein RuvA [Deltaproteobacteria bacterium]|jgi:Holliday junction DNA helicase RuvA|nr:Holliday junction branch migration protein RuvA [Deltaproteobacteria bacterium]